MLDHTMSNMETSSRKPHPFPGMGTRIRNGRVAKKLTQHDLAQRVGVRPLAISLWENEQSVPKAENLPGLARELELSVEELTGPSDAQAEHARRAHPCKSTAPGHATPDEPVRTEA